MKPIYLLWVLLSVLSTAGVCRGEDDCSAVPRQCICNTGSKELDVAGASYVGGWLTRKWQINGWLEVPAGECKLLDRVLVIDKLMNPYYGHLLAFAFTDSRGVWGTVSVEPVNHWENADGRQLCVGEKGTSFHYAVSDSNAATGCQGHVVSASMYNDVFGGGFAVKLTASDRATTIGSRSGRPTSSKNAQTPGKTDTSAPTGRFTHFADGCKAYYRDPQNAKYRKPNSEGFCTCLGLQYLSAMNARGGVHLRQ